ncbi:MAG: TlpA family protein disulfide reductase [Candidatus Krumholzibacteriota bacterium]|nr:TlpA family protein disulfide reductase [Candidatus Krumholzibacteriota bacterium]
MIKVYRRAGLLLFVSFILFSLNCSEKKEEENLKLPSVIDEQMSDSVMALVWKGEIATQEEFNAARNRFAAMLLDSMRTDSQDRYEKICYGELLYFAGQREKAIPILEDLRKGDDAQARNASRALITMKIEDLEFEAAEKMMDDHRKKFLLNSKHPQNLYTCTMDLAGRYNKMDRLDDAIRIYTTELDFLLFDYPYTSFYLASELEALIMLDTNLIPKYKTRIMTYKEKMEEALEHYVATTVYDDSTSQENDEVFRDYGYLIGGFQPILDRLDLIGKKAPEMNFIHVYNADSTLKMNDFRGRVTIIDFWATSCIACVVGYKEMNHLYDDYKDKDVAMLGVTSFLGTFHDMDTGFSEGSKADTLSQQREIELTESYMKKHHIVWPCVVLDRPASKSGYCVGGLPTYVIVDRNGCIQYIQTGMGQEQRLRSMIDKLL